MLDLSLTQIIGGSLAAATGAALTSSLGVAGTIVGAATISVVSVVGGALYTHSLRQTGRRVLAGTAADVRRSARTAPAEPTRAAGSAVDVRRSALTEAAGPERAAGTAVPRQSGLRPRSLLAGAAAVFALAIAGITGYELATGAPISGGTGGTTLNQVTGTGPAAAGGNPADGVPSDSSADTTGPSTGPTSVPTSVPTETTGPSTGTTSPAESTTLSTTPSHTATQEPSEPTTTPPGPTPQP